jgi:hypothetical protein
MEQCVSIVDMYLLSVHLTLLLIVDQHRKIQYMAYGTKFLLIYDLELSWRLNSMKFSRAISHARCLKPTFRGSSLSSSDIRSLKMMTEMVLETSVSYGYLTRLTARVDLIRFHFYQHEWILNRDVQNVLPEGIRFRCNFSSQYF